MRHEIKQVIEIVAAWIIIAFIILIFAPDNLKWLAWVPALFILMAGIFLGIGICLKRAGTFKPVIARINGKEYKACMFCPYNRITDNPVSKNYLITKCVAAGLRIIYMPGKVPGWCPWRLP